jgi:hypothetical protein
MVLVFIYLTFGLVFACFSEPNRLPDLFRPGRERRIFAERGEGRPSNRSAAGRPGSSSFLHGFHFSRFVWHGMFAFFTSIHAKKNAKPINFLIIKNIRISSKGKNV